MRAVCVLCVLCVLHVACAVRGCVAGHCRRLVVAVGQEGVRVSPMPQFDNAYRRPPNHILPAHPMVGLPPPSPYLYEYVALSVGAVAVASALASALASRNAVPPGFRRFQCVYLCVYLLATFGDWLQGPYFYDVYAEYGFTRPQIQALFVVGFGASGIGGTVVGSLADTFGRKRFAVVYFLLYAAGCLLLHVRVIEVLFLGRVLSGIATSLLFSVFESWVVCRHAQRGFPPELLGDTFKWAGLFNGLSAIAAGATAQVQFRFFRSFSVKIFQQLAYDSLCQCLY